MVVKIYVGRDGKMNVLYCKMDISPFQDRYPIFAL